MLLSELMQNEKAIIPHIYANKELKHRFHSFGIMKNQRLELMQCSLAKQTIEILIDATLVALRIEEAEKIEIEKI